MNELQQLQSVKEFGEVVQGLTDKKQFLVFSDKSLTIVRNRVHTALRNFNVNVSKTNCINTYFVEIY